MKKENKEVLKGLTSYLLYIAFGELILYIVLFIIGIKPSKLSDGNKLLVSLIYEGLLLITIILINFKTIKENFIDFKKNIKKYIIHYILYWIFIYFAMMASNMVIYALTKIQTSTNQEQVMDSLYKFPIYSFILTSLIAPFLEELVFRLSFRKMIKNDKLFIILSGITFGALHLTTAQSLPELLYIIPYSIPGFIFAYTLVKSKNIFVPISLHFIHNTALILIQVILIFI